MNYKLTALIVSALCFALPAHAEETKSENTYTLTIVGHKFFPDTLTVPAGKKIILEIDNQDPTPEEFESHDLDREKIIPGNSKATIKLRPLDAGTYKFFGEFNEDTAQGVLIAE